MSAKMALLAAFVSALCVASSNALYIVRAFLHPRLYLTSPHSPHLILIVWREWSATCEAEEIFSFLPPWRVRPPLLSPLPIFGDPGGRFCCLSSRPPDGCTHARPAEGGPEQAKVLHRGASQG